MWFYAALLMALTTAVSVVVNKHVLRKVDPLVLLSTVITTSNLFVIPLAWRGGWPSVNNLFIVGILSSVVFYVTSKIFYYNVIRQTDLSRVQPLMSLSPVFTLLLSMIILAERPVAAEYVAMGVTLFGAYILNVGSVKEGLLEPFKILFKDKLAFWMMISVVLIGAVSVFDKLAINNTYPQNEFFVIVAENVIISICLLPWIIRKRKEAFPQIYSNKAILLLLSVLLAGSNIFAFLALGEGSAGLVTAVFRAQILFVLLFSFIFFKDKPKLETVIGSIIMILGLVLLKIVAN